MLPATSGLDSTARFRPEVEGLRAVAVVLVLLYHAKLGGLSGGYIGVDVFFVLSGFLITSLLMRELATTGTVSLVGFWARRARRLLPASGLVVVATLIASRFMLDGLSQGDLARDAIAACAFVANFRFFNVGTDYLAEGQAVSPLLHFWSLAVEEQYYLVWPGLMLVLVRYARLARRSLIAVLGLMWVASLILCVRSTRSEPMWAFFMLPARAWELLSGALIAVVGGTLWKRAERLRSIVGYVGLAVIVGVAFAYDDATTFPGFAAVAPVLATVAVINAGALPGGPGLFLSASPMLWLGARSYAIYLWHFPVLLLAEAKYGPLNALTRGGLLLGAVGLAALSYMVLENPVRFLPALVRSPLRSLAVGASVALAGIVAASLVLHNPPRLSTDEVAAVPTFATVAPSSTAAATSTPVTSTIPPPPTTAMRPVVADASHDNPPELTPLIAANLALLEESVLNRNVPANLNPSLRDAKNDLPRVYPDDCILEIGEIELKQCVYGDSAGAVTIVLFGDSHAAQWMPAIDLVAKQNAWKLVVHTKKACPSAEIPTVSDPDYTDCAVWRASVIAEIELSNPDLVILSGYRYRATPSVEGRNPDQVWREGLDLTVSKLKPHAQHVLLLGDSSTPAYTVPYCLASNLTLAENCMATREEAIRPSRLAVERDVAAKYDIDFIPTSDWTCTETLCPVIVGNVLMYRDDSHLTATASEFLAPYIELALLHAMT
ncbi:MAG: acyltransferase family protein [Ilumatobacteraceae bacterium]